MFTFIIQCNIYNNEIETEIEKKTSKILYRIICHPNNICIENSVLYVTNFLPFFHYLFLFVTIRLVILIIELVY